jgi:hypothetical protein
MLRLAVSPNLCVYRSDNVQGDIPSETRKWILSKVSMFPKDGMLILFDCEKEGHLFRTKFEFELITT